jgi:hypothetical protein
VKEPKERQKKLSIMNDDFELALDSDPDSNSDSDSDLDDSTLIPSRVLPMCLSRKSGNATPPRSSSSLVLTPQDIPNKENIPAPSLSSDPPVTIAKKP